MGSKAYILHHMRGVVRLEYHACRQSVPGTVDVSHHHCIQVEPLGSTMSTDSQSSQNLLSALAYDVQKCHLIGIIDELNTFRTSRTTHGVCAGVSEWSTIHSAQNRDKATFNSCIKQDGVECATVEATGKITTPAPRDGKMRCQCKADGQVASMSNAVPSPTMQGRPAQREDTG